MEFKKRLFNVISKWIYGHLLLRTSDMLTPLSILTPLSDPQIVSVMSVKSKNTEFLL